MKPQKLFIALFINLLLFAEGFSAPLSGVYTIGGSSPNYTTFTAATNDLNNLGVSGAVTFNVRPGTYNEAFTINNIAGASSANHITFQSEDGIASDVLITYSYSTVTLNGSFYITFHNLSISATVEDYEVTKAFVIQNNCNYDSLTNCILSCPIAPWTDYTFVIYASSGTNDNIVVSSCKINGAGFGYETEGGGSNCGPIFYNNIFTDQTYMAIDLLNTNYTVIQGNTITSNCVTSPQYSGPVTGSRFGIILWNDCNNVQIIENKIYDNIQEGMYIPTIGGGNFLIANNFIQAQEGIYGLYSQGYTILNNSFYTSSYGIAFGYICYGNVVENNIFYSTNGSPIYTLDSTADFTLCDYNDYYTTGPVFGTPGSSSYSSLSSWQTGTGFDTHSKFISPPYLSDTNLHLTNYTPMRFGTPLGTIPIDIDYTLRGSNPTVGADDNGTVVYMPPIPCCGCSTEAFTSNITTLCQGDTVDFLDETGSSATAWSWVFPGGTPGFSNSRNPVIIYDTTGTFDVTLIVTTTSGPETLTKTSYITVNGLPAAGIITANPDSVCPGSSSQLSVTGNTGTIQWQSSTDAVSFSDISSANSTGYTTPALTQTAYYRVNVSNACGTDSSATERIFVIPAPNPGVPFAQPDTVCSGAVVQLASTGTSGSQLQWQSSLTGNSYSNINGADSAIYTTSPLQQSANYRLIVSNGACSDTSASIVVFVRPAPAPPALSVNDSLICASDSARIQAPGGYSSYHWNDGDTGSFTYVNNAGDNWVTVTDINGCSAVSGHQKISVYPVSSVSIVLSGDTLSSFGEVSYQWYLNDIAIPNATGEVYIATQAGNYAVQVTDTNGCKALSNNTAVSITGVNNVPGNYQPFLYPNPASDIVFISRGDKTAPCKIRILNIAGQEVQQQNFPADSKPVIQINIAALPAGIYELQVLTDNNLFTSKLIKQ